MSKTNRSLITNFTKNRNKIKASAMYCCKQKILQLLSTINSMQKQSIIKDLEELKNKIESIIETLEIMSDDELMDSIKKGVEEVRRGKLKDFDELLNESGNA